jgi:predicted enzyme related to lactoylglutathione lyase
VWWPEHIGVVARDLDETVTFYGALFDSDPIETVVWRGGAAEYVADLLAVPGLTLKAAFFQVPFSRTILELIEYSNIGSADDVSLPPTSVGATHFGFYVESVEEAAERVHAAGAEFLAPPVEIPYGPYSGGRTAYFRDPNGVNLQVREVVARPGGIPVLRRSEPVGPFEME